MLIGSNEACRVLAACGLSRRHAQRVLAARLAGEPRRVRGRVLYDQQRVRELVRRPNIAWPTVLGLCPAGLFVSRRPVPVAATASRADLVEALSGGWGAISPWEWTAMGLQVRAHGSLPMVATLAGFVVFGADVVALRGFSRVVLAEPGSWFEPLACARLSTGPNRPWVLHLGPIGPVPRVGGVVAV